MRWPRGSLSPRCRRSSVQGIRCSTWPCHPRLDKPSKGSLRGCLAPCLRRMTASVGCTSSGRSRKKDEINRSEAGNAIGADDLPAVTQLFTEPYMVRFLLRQHPGSLVRRQVALSERIPRSARQLTRNRRGSAAESRPTIPGVPLRFRVPALRART